MKSRSHHIAIALLSLCVALPLACDTEQNIDPKNTFLRYYGTRGNQVAVDMALGADGSIYMLGNSGLAVYLVKADAEGNSLWENTFLDAEAKDIEIGSDGNLLITGTITGADRDVFILRVNAADGAAIGQPAVYGYSGFDEDAYSITEISNGYIVSGSTTRVLATTGADQADGFMFRFNADLTPYGVTWTERYGPGTFDVIVKTFQAGPGLFYIFGFSNQSDNLDSVDDYNFFAFNANDVGVPNSLKFILGEPGSNERLTSVVPIPVQSGGGYLLSGVREGANGNFDVYAMRIRNNIETSASVEQIRQGNPGILTNGLTNDSGVKVYGFASGLFGFYILATRNSSGNGDIFLNRVTNDLQPSGDDWGQAEGYSFGGIGNDQPAAVLEAADGAVLVLGTMVLGDVNGQQKMVLMKLDRRGRL